MQITLQKSTEIQTLIFDASKFNVSEAKKWAADNGFHATKVDETQNSIRLRQHDPSEYADGSFRTISLTDGVKAVIGKPKVAKGGPGSGNFGHSGRPGEVGGSGEGGGSSRRPARDLGSHQSESERIANNLDQAGKMIEHNPLNAEQHVHDAYSQMSREVRVGLDDLRDQNGPAARSIGETLKEAENDLDGVKEILGQALNDNNIVAVRQDKLKEAYNRLRSIQANLTDEGILEEVEKREGDGMAKLMKDDRKKLHDAAEARSKRYGIPVLETGGNLTPPSGGPTSEADFGDPVNYKYPVHDVAHARNALARLAQAGDVYGGAVGKVRDRIEQAAKKFGIEVTEKARKKPKLRFSYQKEHEMALKHLQQAMDAGDLEACKQHVTEAIQALAEYDDATDSYKTKRADTLDVELDPDEIVEEELDLDEPAPSRMTNIRKVEGGIEFDLDVAIVKLDAAQRLVAGVVYEPDVVDAQGDSASAEEIEKACHDFMLNNGRMGLMHKDDVSGKVRIVENYITKASEIVGNQKVKKGAWVMVLKILDDAIWKDVQEGNLTGLSMAGYAANADELTND